MDALRYVCEEVGCVENQREAAALLCALAVPHENKLPLAESGSAEPLMLMCQSVDVEVHSAGYKCNIMFSFFCCVGAVWVPLLYRSDCIGGWGKWAFIQLPPHSLPP